MYSIEQKHAFEHNIVLTKMTPFNIQFGEKRPLDIQRIYSFGQKHTVEYSPCKISRKMAEKSKKTCATANQKTKYSAVKSTV